METELLISLYKTCLNVPVLDWLMPAPFSLHLLSLMDHCFDLASETLGIFLMHTLLKIGLKLGYVIIFSFKSILQSFITILFIHLISRTLFKVTFEFFEFFFPFHDFIYLIIYGDIG